MMPVILAVLFVGALIGVGLTIIAPRIKKEKYNQTQDTLDAAIQAVMSWSAANDRLPTATTFPMVVRNINDAWRKNLVYGYDNNLTTPSTGGICGRQTTGIASGTTGNIAFLLVSGGDDYTVNSTPNTSGPYSGNVTLSANDIVKLVSLEKLKNKAGCYATARGRLRIINNELPRACNGQPYTATLYAEYGVPFTSGGLYKWCIKGSLPTGVTATPITPACPLTTDCSALGSEAAAQWSQANTLLLSGTPTLNGNFNVIVLVRDNNDNNLGQANDNCVQQAFSITVATCP
ncbi:MAG: hypothetical protein KKH68_11530 [Proteobacteria bacterium]|nr:hypothetical protein [Pseudomonadota bacterium]